MISNPTIYRRGNQLLAAAVVFSILVHVAGIATYLYIQGLLPWLKPPTQKPEQPIVLSTATRVSRITVPELSHAFLQGRTSARLSRPEPRMMPQPQRPAQQPHRASPARVAAAAAPRKELTVVKPSAPPMVPSPMPSSAPARPQRATASSPETLAQMLAREQPMYEREIAQMRQENPLSTATIKPRPASALRKAYFNVSGVDRNLDRFEGLVTPTRTWYENGMRCHYADYDIEYQYGGSDSNSIPWPLCYSPALDPMTLPDGTPAPTGTPVPLPDLFPMPGYVLPQGYPLTPFLELLYKRDTG